MQWKTGNIWLYWGQRKIIVIPTNAGWNKEGKNVMGAGLAKEAAEKYPYLSKQYGACCIQKKPHQYFEKWNLICVPTKPLNERFPSLSWKQNANERTVEESLIWLNNLLILKEIYVPLLGCGNGKLDEGRVSFLMEKYLDSRFIGVKN
jgi:hypothetical protein